MFKLLTMRTDPLEYAGGEFDADESAKIIQAAGASKAKLVSMECLLLLSIQSEN